MIVQQRPSGGGGGGSGCCLGCCAALAACCTSHDLPLASLGWSRRPPAGRLTLTVLAHRLPRRHLLSAVSHHRFSTNGRSTRRAPIPLSWPPLSSLSSRPPFRPPSVSMLLVIRALLHPSRLSAQWLPSLAVSCCPPQPRDHHATTVPSPSVALSRPATQGRHETSDLSGCGREGTVSLSLSRPVRARLYPQQHGFRTRGPSFGTRARRDATEAGPTSCRAPLRREGVDLGLRQPVEAMQEVLDLCG